MGVNLKKEVLSHTEYLNRKYDYCKQLSTEGKEMEDFLNILANRFKYNPLPPDIAEKALAYYLNALPGCFYDEEKDKKHIHFCKSGYYIDGKKQPIYAKDGTKICEEYDRIVIGHYGAFIEIDNNKIDKNVCTTKKGEEYRETPKYKDSVKYFYKTVGDTNNKIYHQKRTVRYADYKENKYYISPFEVMSKEECLSNNLSWCDTYNQTEKQKLFLQKLKEENKERIDGQSIDIEDLKILGINPTEIAVFDFETTGLIHYSPDTPKEDRTPCQPLQLCVYSFDENFNPVEITNTYFKPSISSWDKAMAVNGITPEMVKDSPKWNSIETKEAIQGILNNYSVLAGHNIIGFDIKVLEKMKINTNNFLLLDTLPICRKLWKKTEAAHNLKSCSEMIMGEDKLNEIIEGKTLHDASTDVLVNSHLISSLYKGERYFENNKNIEERE